MSSGGLAPGLVLLHGDAGSWDEIAVAVIGFVVIWAAVKLAGRKRPADGEAEAPVGDEAEAAPPVAPGS